MKIDIYQSYEETKKIILEIDPNFKVWEFGNASNFGLDFQSGDFTISTIDLFGGNIPRLTSVETIKWHSVIPLIPTVILDSNVMSLLSDFVLHPEQLDENKKKAIVKLLDYFIHDKFDYSPVFYSIEAYVKNQGREISKHSIEFSKAILTLHMMDELHFLKTREIRPSEEQFRRYSEKFGVNDIDEMARIQHETTRQMLFSYEEDLKVFYLIIMKMALIHKTSNKSITKKMEMLFEFTFSNFKALFAEELAIAGYYFAGQLDRLIPLQKDAHFERAISRLRATTWDIYLLRFPPLLLSQTGSKRPLAKICTCEKDLVYIGRKFFVWKLFTSENEFYPALRIDYSDLEKVLPKSTLDDLLQLLGEFEQARKDRKAGSVIKMNDSKMEEIKLSLEHEIKALCG